MQKYKQLLILLGMTILLSSCGNKTCTLDGKSICTNENKTGYQIEEKAKITIEVNDKNYGEAIVKLWNESYPQHSNALTYVIVKDKKISDYKTKDVVNPDLMLVNDRSIGALQDIILEIDEDIENYFEIKTNKNYTKVLNKQDIRYIPMETHGLLFTYDISKLKELEIKEESMKSIEALIATKKENIMYMNSNFNYVYPLLSSDFTILEKNIANKQELDSTEFKNALMNYKTIYEGLKLKDEPKLVDSYFINQNYASGLVDEWMQIEQSEELNGSKIVYSKLPTYKDKQLYTLGISKGYVVSKDTKYPSMANQVLVMLRGQRGMQIFIDNNLAIASIKDEDIDLFKYNKAHYKEKVSAYNGSIQMPLVGLSKNSSISAIDYYYSVGFNDKLNMYINNKLDLENTQNGIVKDSNAWLNENNK